MRIHAEGDYAYDLEQSVDRATQLRTGWSYRLFRLRPTEQVLERGEADTREEAERKAKRAVSRLLQKERRTAA